MSALLQRCVARLPLTLETRSRLRLVLRRLLRRPPPRIPDPAGWVHEADAYFSPRHSALGEIGAAALAFEQPAAPAASVIIPVHNKLDYTLHCLYALQEMRNDTPFEVIIYDDASSDPTAETLGAVPGLRLERSAENLGFVRACNAAAQLARGRYLVFLNNDTAVQDHWLDELVQTAMAIPAAGIVGSMLLNADGSLQEAGCLVWNDGDCLNYGRNRDPRHPDFNFLRDTDYCSGASILVPRKLYLDIGGFDERFSPAYYEDTDLAFRIRDRGWRVLYQPLSRTVHFEGATGGRNPRRGVKRHQEQNRQAFRSRWRGELERRPAVMDVAAALRRGAGRNILIVDATTPTPDQDSGSVDAFYLMKLLREMRHDVTFVPEGDLLYMGRYTRALQRLGVRCLYSPWTRRLGRVLRRQGRDFDLVILNRVDPAYRHIGAVRRYCPRARTVFNTVDLHFTRAERQARFDTAVSVSEVQRLRERELDVVRRADITLVMSRAELQTLGELCPGNRLVEFPLIMELDRVTPRPFDERSGIVFLGGFRHAPNVDAVRYLAEELWPGIRARLPGVSCTIIGSNMPESLRRLSRDGLEVAGYVADLAPRLDGARLMVAPLRFGAGIKGKIGRSLGHGLPCVATSVAVEGMGLQNGEQILIADSISDFTDAVVGLYNDRILWQKLSHSARHYFEANYSMTAARDRVLDLLESCMPRARAEAQSST